MGLRISRPVLMRGSRKEGRLRAWFSEPPNTELDFLDQKSRRTTPVKVFVSHSFQDSPKFDEFSRLLNQQEIPFFRPLDMKGTRSLAEQLREAINDCEVCIFVATYNSVKSDWCHAELGAFWGAGKNVIIYLADSSLDDKQLPKQFQGHLHERDMFRVVETVNNLVKKDILSLPAEGFLRARQVHGYSGKWYVKSLFTHWRGREIGADESVVFNGETSLLLQMDGKRGSGMQRGTLQVDLKDYHLKLRVCNEILEASISEKGTLNVKLKVYHRGFIQPVEGAPPDDLGKDWLEDVDNAPPFDLELEPCPGKPKCLHGWHRFQPGKNPHQKADEEWTCSDV